MDVCATCKHLGIMTRSNDVYLECERGKYPYYSMAVRRMEDFRTIIQTAESCDAYTPPTTPGSKEKANSL